MFHAQKAEAYEAFPSDLEEQFRGPSEVNVGFWWQMFSRHHHNLADFKRLYVDYLRVTDKPVLTRVTKFLIRNSMFLPHHDDADDVRRHDNDPPFIQAVNWYHKELVACLISGANEKVDKLTEWGNSAVDFAAYYGFKNILEILLLGQRRQQLTKKSESRARFDMSTFEVVVKLLLDWGLSGATGKKPPGSLLDVLWYRKPKMFSYNTPLLDFEGVYAAYPGPGYDPELYKWIGNALQSAVSLGDIENTHLLLDWGADPNASGGCCGTPLMDAASGGDTNLPILKLLMEYGAKVHGSCQVHENQKYDKYEDLYADWHTPLQYAASKGCLGKNTVEFLVQHDADLDAEEHMSRYTALHAAVGEGESAEEVIRFLIDNDANVKVSIYCGNLLGHAVKVAEKGTIVEFVAVSITSWYHVTTTTNVFRALLD
jgi:ankyrin repeat protein